MCWDTGFSSLDEVASTMTVATRGRPRFCVCKRGAGLHEEKFRGFPI
jgi:hypothetical protein